MYSSQVAGRGRGPGQACGSKVHGYWLKAALQIALLLAIPGIAVAQFTQVSGTVVDPNGIAYANGTIMPTLVISGSPRFAATGLPYTPPTTPSGLDTQGRFVLQLADVNQLIPAGGVWTFTVNCTGGCIPPGVGVGPVTFTTTGIVITGATQDISSVLQAAAPPLTGGGGGGVHINGNPTSAPNFNSTTPPPPPNSAPIVFQVSGSNVSAALEGNGNSDDCFHGDGIFKPCGVTSIDSLIGAFNFTGAVTCTAGTPNVCNFTGGTGGSGTVGAGTAGQYAIYNGPNSVGGSSALTSDGTTITASIPLTASTINVGVGAIVGSSTSTCPVLAGTICITSTGIIQAFSSGGGGFRNLVWPNVNGSFLSGTATFNFNNTSPAATSNGRNISWQSSGGNVSAQLVGDGIVTDCFLGNGTFGPCPSGTLTNPITLPLPAASLPTLTGNGGFGLQFAAACCANSAVPSMWVTGANVTGANWQPIPWISINGTGPANLNNQNFTHAGGTGEPALPGNAVSMTWARTGPTGAASSRQDISAYLLGDGSTNCLSGQGTYVACGSATGSGTVGNGVAGQFAFYTGTNTVQGTANLTNNLNNLATIVPFEFIAPSALPPPVPGANLLTVDPTGALVYSQNGGAFAPVGGGGGGSGTVGAGTAGQFALYNGTTSVAGTPDLTDSGSSIVANLPLSANTITTFNVASGAGLAPPTLAAGFGGFALAAGGVPEINANGAGWVGLNSVTTVGSSAITTPGLTLANTGNPATPTNGYRLTFASTQQSTTNTMIGGFIVGDGVATDCLVGTGIFTPCPGGTGGGGVTSIDSLAGAFNFTGAVSCTAGTPNTCNFTGTGTGIGGSGSPGFMPMFINTTALGNGPVQTLNSTGIPSPGIGTLIIVDPHGLPLQPTTTTGAGFSTGIESEVSAAASSCPGNATTPGTSVTCTGEHIYYSQEGTATNGNFAALFAQNIGGAAAGVAQGLNIGVLGSVATQTTAAEERAGYFEANDSSLDTGATTTRRGVMGVAQNATNHTTALNEGVVAQTGVAGGTSINTQDYSMHCLAPSIASGGTFTTHACLKIEPQGTGVELQTGAHIFANLPACSTAYEGSMAAITDASATSGTVTGGGSNHVLIYCNGTAWTAAAGGGGGAASDLTCTTNANTLWSNSSGNATICTFNLAANHNYIIRCVYSIAFATQSTSAVSDVDVGIHVVNGPANVSYFRGTFTDPSKTFADQSSVSGVTGTAGNGGVPNDFNLMRAANIGSSPPNTTNNEEGFGFTIDGVYPTSAAGDTLIFYVGSSLAGSGGNVLPGAYCRLE